MLWIKSLHIVFLIAWFAGLFYLPHLFVYHSMMAATDREGHDSYRDARSRATFLNQGA